MGSPKMSSIARYLSQGVRLIATQRITQLAYNGTWSLTSENNTYEGYDLIVLAIPATQVLEIEGLTKDVYELAASIAYGAINTLLIEMKSPLWFENYEEDRVDGPIIHSVIADSC